MTAVCDNLEMVECCRDRLPIASRVLEQEEGATGMTFESRVS